MTDVAFKKLYDEIIKNRTEIKCAIEASETRLLLEIQEDKRKIEQLEKENLKLRDEIETLKKADKKNNIIIFGVKHRPKSISTDFIQQTFKDLLNIELKSYDINNTYTIGNLEDSPIKVELTTYLKKEEILKNCNKLKGTNIVINHDQTIQQREENRELRKYMKEAKQNKTKKCYIRNNIYINDTAYTLAELKQLEDIGETESNSATQTPSTTLNKESGSEQTIVTPGEEKTDTPKATGVINKTNKPYDRRNRLRSNK